MKYITLVVALLITSITWSQSNLKEEKIDINSLIEGTLLVPENQETLTLAIIIQGSGPTDRDGNQPNAKNNSLKYLAEGLSNNGIATFRYDKRLVKLARQGNLKEEEISFDHFIDDAEEIITYFQNQERFKNITVIGHSQGSLVGMVAAYRNQADAFVSIAGAGQEIDDVIVEQLQRQAPALVDDARQSFDDLRVNGIALNYGEGLASIFRPGIQPFMRTWMQYNPQTEIAKLEIPVLILNGTEDVQVDEEEAKLLHRAKPNAEMYLIENMNHVLKEIAAGDTMDNYKSYNEPKRPVVEDLVEKITVFINALEK
ncbi:alpha/beta hydrolase [Planktosalinus lacus]|uniref:Alpha/beta hydrolase n=1 Tax=Planktosalinus lacus TaxID=1526573 RepID=A0A8J2Y9H7_9FLAO|nr:alpha/beta hydrolase [Planktosalinus lacus]GGD98881.1 alpha/beta hydrolase [Planktosalinus lacus]